MDAAENDLKEFHILTAESTFLVRTFFFLFFGFSIKILNFSSFDPLFYGLLIILVIFLIRYIYFTITNFKLKPSPLVYMSPRGLISILLFIQLKDINFVNLNQSIIDERVLLVVILISMIVMLIGTMKKIQLPKEVKFNESDQIEIDLDPNLSNLDESENS